MANHPQSDAKHGAHGHGMGRYVAVWLILLVFTVVTVLTGRMHMPVFGIYLAMAIACTKAALVVLFFMHLSESGAVNKLVFASSVVFVGVLLIGVFGDIWTRNTLTIPNHGPAPRFDDVPAADHDRDEAEAEAHHAGGHAEPPAAPAAPAH